MPDTVQIPEAPIEYSNEEVAAWQCGYRSGYELSQHRIKLFRRKLSNITLDELLKNTGIILELFDEHFKNSKP